MKKKKTKQIWIIFTPTLTKKYMRAKKEEE